MNHVATDDEVAAEGRRERNKVSKRRRIEEAATELFTEQGFESTTTAAIAKRAGIGAGTLYLYVDSKDDLLVEVFRQQVGPVWEEAFAMVDRDRPVLDQLISVFNHVAEFHEHDTNLSRAFFKNLRFVASPVIDGAEEFVRRHGAQLTELLERAQADGRLDPDVSAVDLADNLYALWTTLMSRRYAGRRTWDQYLVEIDRSLRTCLFRLQPADT
ncbi:MAG: TetR/AcrR family transcriptional regulator [Acidimicrobiales bacterium]